LAAIEHYTSAFRVQVGKNSKNISNAVPLTFARVTQRLAFWLVRKGVGSTTIKGKRYSAFTFFFLDKETNSYDTWQRRQS